MLSANKYLLHHGLLLPKETHSWESLTFLQEFAFKDDDVVAVTYPKSGTVWMQEILPLVMTGGDLTPVQTLYNWDRVPWLEETRLSKIVDSIKSPRLFASHLPFNLMSSSFQTSKAKVIYVMRNPKDVMVSSFYFHQSASFLDDPGTFDEFMDKFLEGRVLFGKWTEHVKSWRHTGHEDRILYITYEDLVQDLSGTLRNVSTFLGKSLKEDVIKKIAEHCKFSNMKLNKMSNFSAVQQDIMDQNKSPFFRKGISGDWKNHFSSDQLARFSAVIVEELEGESDSLFYDLK